MTNGRSYYNEIDPYCAQWLRNLIAAGHIADGDVDERSIEDVRPGDVRGYTQCHFFAGIGVWSYALRLAGWPDDRPVWTGSCPCQPFSQAGKGAGFADERHLWPAWFHLIRECRPTVVFGEQSSAGIRHGWIDLVRADVEGEGYAVAHSVLGAHCVGAPHIRQRCWFVADALREPSERRAGGVLGTQAPVCGTRLENGNLPDRFANGGEACVVGDSNGSGFSARSETATPSRHRNTAVATGWNDCEWVYCTDDKYRPIEPGTFPMVTGHPSGLEFCRAYGNAIVPQVAAAFIRAYCG